MDARFVTEAPLWVWPLLAFLIWVGLRATKEREAPVAIYWLMPLFVLLSLNAMMETARPDVAWPAFAVSYLAGARVGFAYQARVVIARTARRVRVRGEWITLATIMAVFCLGYARGALGAVAPEFLASPHGAAAVAAISGALSGQFAGRALSVIRWRPGRLEA